MELAARLDDVPAGRERDLPAVRAEADHPIDDVRDLSSSVCRCGGTRLPGEKTLPNDSRAGSVIAGLVIAASRGMERETGFEPATCSLEGRDA
jgi:hypothetical protein